MTIIDFSEYLQGELEARGWKPAALAERAGLDPAIISRALKSERLPSPDSLSAIAQAFDYPPEFVFRKAGLLPARPEQDEVIEKIVHLANQMDEIEKAEFLEYAELLRRRKSRRDLVAEFVARYRSLTREEAKEAQRKLFTELGIIEPGSRRSS